MKNAIVSFANMKGNYIKGLARLSESLRNNFDGDFLSWIGEKSLGAEKHETNPYNFKIHAFRKAIDAGYENILWLDSSCFAIKNVQLIFDYIEQYGFIFQDAGHFVADWTNDYTLNYFGITREQTTEWRMIGNAGLLGLNIFNDKALEFLNKWEAAMNAGCFKGAWDNHRHDMSSSSIIIQQMGLFCLAKSGEEILQYAGLFDETANDTIIIKAQGI